MWAIDVMSKYSSANKNDLFCTMFHDSDVAKNFACGKTKCSYIVNFGVAPYFKELFDATLNEVEYFVALFDESYNHICKQSQMDFHVGYWDCVTNQVVTRYYTSEFLGKASSDDIYNKFMNCCPKIDANKLLQISSDGPNVNLSFLNIINEKRDDNELQQLLYIGTCGLHTVHNGLQHGEKASQWSPARRANYETLVTALLSDYPLKFYPHRWTENEPISKRAQEVWPKIIEIVKFWIALPKSKQPGRG